MPPPSVTILVPVFNPGPLVDATIESALRQTFRDFELIVIDDGSTDGTAGRVRRFTDSRLRLVEQAHQGAPSALNAGLRLARGRYVALLDHDDLWKPDKLERHVELLDRSPGLDATFSWTRLIDQWDCDLGPHSIHWQGTISLPQMLSYNVFTTTSAWVLRASALHAVSGFDPALPYYYDLDLILRLALLRPANVCALAEELNFYRIHPGQMSLVWRPWVADLRTLLGKVRVIAPDTPAAVLARADCLKSSYFAYLAYRCREHAPACRLLLHAFASAPGAFLAQPWNWKVSAASFSGLLLPAAVHARLERLAGASRHARS